jgi:hypothetical protein
MHVFKEEDLPDGLDFLANQIGMASPQYSPAAENSEHSLANIYDENVEAAVRAAYQRDYMMFGFKPWEA